MGVIGCSNIGTDGRFNEFLPSANELTLPKVNVLQVKVALGNKLVSTVCIGLGKVDHGTEHRPQRFDVAVVQFSRKAQRAHVAPIYRIASYKNAQRARLADVYFLGFPQFAWPLMYNPVGRTLWSSTMNDSFLSHVAGAEMFSFGMTFVLT